MAHVANTKDPKNDLTDNNHNNAANADPADSGNGVQKTLRKAAKALAGSVPAAVKPAATVTGHGATQTTTPLANGLYLVVDSKGSPMIVAPRSRRQDPERRHPRHADHQGQDRERRQEGRAGP